MKDIYTEVAKKAAHAIWQTASTIIPQVGVWLAAIATGNTVDWAFGHKKPTENQEPKKSWLSSLNPFSAIKSLNPTSLISFAVKPFTSIKKAASWFLFEDFAHEMQDKINVPFKAAAPIAEKFMTPILEKMTTPALNFLQEHGLMQFPQPDVVCPSIVCPTVVCELPVEEIKEIAKQAAAPETQHFFSRALNYLSQPILDLSGSAANTVTENPTPLEQVFSEPVQEAATEAAKSFVEPIKVATKEVVKAKVPTTYLELTEHYAEPAGRYVAETMSAAYQGASKAIYKPAEITSAIKGSINLLSEATGVRPSLVVAAGIGVIGLAGLGAYAAYRGAYGWYNKNTAVADAHAQASGGHANVNFLVQFPSLGQQGGSPVQPLAGIPLPLQTTEASAATFKA